MHELSLAQSLLEQITSLADEHRAKRISKVTVLLGPFSGIVADSFSFGFNVLKEHNELTRHTELILETPSPSYTCLDCNTSVTVEPQQQSLGSPRALSAAGNIRCTSCDSTRLSPAGGSELILKQLEME